MFSDSFDGAGAATNLSDWTPTGGTGWALVAGVAGAIKVETDGKIRGTSTTHSAFVCDDQGDADHYSEVVGGTGIGALYLAVRLVDENNFIGWWQQGTGSTGFRLAKMVGNVRTDLVTAQGSTASERAIRVEAEGDTIRIYEGGVQVGTDQTVTNFNTETSQGLVNKGVWDGAKVRWAASFEADALSGGGTTYTATASLSAAIQAARTATASLSGAIQQGRTTSASADAAIQRALSASASLDAALLQAHTATAGADAAILQARTAAASLDALIQSGGSFTATASLDAAIRQAFAASASLDAAIQRAASASASLDAAVLANRSAQASLDAFIEAPGTVSASLDAAILAPHTAAASLSAAIQQARTAVASLDAAIATRYSASASADAFIYAPSTVQASLDAAVQAAQVVSASLNAYIVEAGATATLARARSGARDLSTRRRVNLSTSKRR